MSDPRAYYANNVSNGLRLLEAMIKNAVRDDVHVADLASAHVLALQHLVGGGASLQLNLGTGRGYSVSEVAKTASAVCHVDISTHISPRRAGDPPLLVADGRVAQRTLGWVPQLSDLESILASAWKWHRRNAPRP